MVQVIDTRPQTVKEREDAKAEKAAAKADIAKIQVLLTALITSMNKITGDPGDPNAVPPIAAVPSEYDAYKAVLDNAAATNNQKFKAIDDLLRKLVPLVLDIARATKTTLRNDKALLKDQD